MILIIFTASVICTWSSWRCVEGDTFQQDNVPEDGPARRAPPTAESPLVRSLSAQNSSEIHLRLSPTNYTCRTPPDAPGIHSLQQQYSRDERPLYSNNTVETGGSLQQQYSREPG